MLCRTSIDHFGVDITLISTWASEAHTTASSERENNDIEGTEMKQEKKKRKKTSPIWIFPNFAWHWIGERITHESSCERNVSNTIGMQRTSIAICKTTPHIQCRRDSKRIRWRKKNISFLPKIHEFLCHHWCLFTNDVKRNETRKTKENNK